MKIEIPSHVQIPIIELIKLFAAHNYVLRSRPDGSLVVCPVGRPPEDFQCAQP